MQLPELKELTFDSEPHIYRLNGVTIPSVSAVIEPLSRIKYSGISENTLDKAAAKGTEVHNSIENWLKFEIEDISAERRPYFDAFRDWWEQHNIQVVGSELRIYHKILSYAGTVDLLSCFAKSFCLLKTMSEGGRTRCRLIIWMILQITPMMNLSNVMA